ncbi:MAG: type II toxin-antitoxin system VapC family toxin [Patescibacteria group bacterium]
MLVDTNILILYLNGDEAIAQTLSEWKLSGKIFYISSISRAEVLSGFNLTDAEISNAAIWLEENFISISFDDKIADIAGQIRRGYKLKLPDAGIAATSIISNNPLLTRNIKDFKKVKELTIVSI